MRVAMAIDPDSLRERQRYDAHMRESKMASLRAEAEYKRLDAAIGAGDASGTGGSAPKAAALFAEMLEERTQLIERLARSRALGAARWRETLAQLDLGSAGAEAELMRLRDSVERERAMWRHLPAAPALGRHARDAAAQDVWSRDLDTDLMLIAASLGVLAACRGTYGSLT
jgi:hypothetical protein